MRSPTIQPGDKLVFFKEIAENRTEQLAEQESEKVRKKAGVIAQTKRFKSRYHHVQDGDTLWNIARRYDGLTIDRLKKMNNIRGNALKAGQKLIVG